MNRCYRPDHDSYGRYGGRGISVCERWHTFENFAADMGEPKPGQQIDRIDTEGDYKPENCRWTSQVENANNKSSSRLLTINGKTQTMAQWAREAGVNYIAFSARVRRGWDLEKAINTKGR